MQASLDYHGERVGRALALWVDIVRRTALWVVLVSIVVSGFLLHYTVTHLGINTDTADMISERLPWRRTYIQYKQAFPQYIDNILVVIDGATPDLADHAQKRLAARIEGDTRLFQDVYLPGADSFFERHGLLYLSVEELEDLADNLAQVQPFLGKLMRDQSVTGLVSMLEKAMDAARDGEGLDLTPLFKRLSEVFTARSEGRFYQLSWQELMLGRASTPQERRRFILAQPELDFSMLLPGKAAIEEIRELAGELALDEAHGIHVRITGSVALASDELQGVSQGAGLAGVLALALVGLVLYFGLRSLRLLLASLLTLIAGLVATAAFAAYAVGHLNLISVAFAVLYIGLGIDYAIHYCLRYRELVLQGRPHAAALREAASDVGTSLVVCAITTSVGFYAFVPTAYAGVSELGLISGTGMFISLVANVTLLPALLTLMPLRRKTIRQASPGGRLGKLLAGLPLRYARIVRVSALVTGLAAVALLPRVQFDYNPLNLRDPTTESAATFNELLTNSDTSPLTIAIVADDATVAQETADRIGRLDRIDTTRILTDFLPEKQEDKLAMIDEMALLLGPELELADQANDLDSERAARALDTLQASLEGFVSQAGPEQSAAAHRLSEALQRFRAELERQPGSKQQQMLIALEESLLAALPERLAALRTSLKAGPVGLEDLPTDLVERWVSPNGGYRVEVFPKENIAGNQALRRFVEQVRSAAPEATGAPVLSLAAGDAVVQAFQQAFLSAFLAICVLLFLLLRSLSAGARVLAPLLLAAALTGAATVLLDLPFNFANVIALPLILGVGVDSGIHMVHRAHTAPPADGNLLTTSTGRAVLFSALTTMCSFGSLAFSKHLGMASMGQLLTVGIGLTSLCMLAVLPALFTTGGRRDAAT